MRKNPLTIQSIGVEEPKPYRNQDNIFFFFFFYLTFLYRCTNQIYNLVSLCCPVMSSANIARYY